jgi:hypothetical protein
MATLGLHSGRLYGRDRPSKAVGGGHKPFSLTVLLYWQKPQLCDKLCQMHGFRKACRGMALQLNLFPLKAGYAELK